MSTTSATWWTRLKPAASRRNHLTTAAGVWSAAGTGLVIAGLGWLLGQPPRLFVPAILLSAGAGMVKSRLVLDRMARRLVSRVEARGDGRCIGGFVAWWSWLMVLFFSAISSHLRNSGLSPLILGGVYLAVGLALLRSSTFLWSRARRQPAP